MNDSFTRGYMAGWTDAVDQLKAQIVAIELVPRPGEPPYGEPYVGERRSDQDAIWVCEEVRGPRKALLVVRPLTGRIAPNRRHLTASQWAAMTPAPPPTEGESRAVAALSSIFANESTHISGPAPEQPKPERGYAHCVRCQRRHRRPVATGLLDPCFESLSEGSP